MATRVSSGLLLFLNFFSVKTTVSRFQIAASIAQVTATVLVIGTGFYFLVFKGTVKVPSAEASYLCRKNGKPAATVPQLFV